MHQGAKKVSGLLETTITLSITKSQIEKHERARRKNKKENLRSTKC